MTRSVYVIFFTRLELGQLGFCHLNSIVRFLPPQKKKGKKKSKHCEVYLQTQNRIFRRFLGDLPPKRGLSYGPKASPILCFFFGQGPRGRRPQLVSTLIGIGTFTPLPSLPMSFFSLFFHHQIDEISMSKPMDHAICHPTFCLSYLFFQCHK